MIKLLILSEIIHILTNIPRSSDYLGHLFVERPFTMTVWFDIEEFLSSVLNRDICLPVTEKLLGSLQEGKLVNHVILLVEKHICYQRNKNDIPSHLDLVITWKLFVNWKKRSQE